VDTGAAFKGNAGDDTYVANLTNNNNGVATVETLTALDSLDGGAGNDTLNYYTDDGVAVPGATLANIETLNVVSGATAVADVSGSNVTGLTTLTTKAVGDVTTITTKSNVTSVTASASGTNTSVGITDAGTAGTATPDKLATVSVTGNAGAVTVSSDVLTTLSLTKEAQNATITAAAGTRALTVNLNEVTGGTITDATATSLAVNASGVKSSGVTLTAGAATAVTIDATKVTLGVADVNIGAAKTLTVTGDSVVTIGATTGVGVLTTVTSTNTGGVTITPTLATGVTFTGGAGKDTISLTAGTVKASTLGAGDDKVTLTGAFGAGGSVDGGDGIDTLQMASADAATVSATTTFKTGFTNFEKLSLGATAQGATDTVQLANMNNLNYVVSAGTAGGTGGTTETSSVVFSGLKIGQSATVGGVTVTATADLTAANVASAFSGATVTGATKTGALSGFTAAAPSGNNADTVVFTATTAGNVTNFDNVAASVTNIAGPTAPAVTTTQGVSTATESSVVTFGSLNAGEVATAAGKTVTAAAARTESASIVFSNMALNSAVTINGLTVTATTGTAVAADIATAFKTGVTTGNATVSGLWQGGYSNDNGATTVVFTSNTPNANVTNLASTGTGNASAAVTVTDGFNGVVTAAEVATAMATGGVTIANKLTVGGTLTGFTTSAVQNTNQVTFTSSTASSNVTDIVVTSTGNQPTVATTQGNAGTTESSSIVFSGLLAGQSLTVGDLTLTATGADLTAAQVAEAMDGNDGVGYAGAATPLAAAVLSGNGAAAKVPTGFTAGAITSGTTVVYTSGTATTNVTDITTATNNITAATAPAVTNTDGGVGAATGGALNVTGFGAAGTFELTSAITGASSLALANSSGTADEITLKLNGTSNIVNTAVTTIANVEKITIQTTDSQVVTASTPTDIDPTAPSTVLLNAAGATNIVVTGNHGVNFAGSTLTNLVNLDASGVAATGIAAANQTATTTATNIGTAGAVTFSSGVTDKAVTVITGNGNDVINLSTATLNAPFLATGVTTGTVTTGAGNDTVTGSAGKDVVDLGAGNDTYNSSLGADTITLGAGNDTYVLGNQNHSTVSVRDTITDFSANTYGQGTSGAVNSSGATNTLTSRNGDVINIDAINGALTTVRVGVFGNAADAQTFVQNGNTDAVANSNIALDSSTGYLYIDADDNGVVDSVIVLTGVTTINAAAFVTSVVA